MKRFDEFVIVIDVFYIIQLLPKVTGSVKNIGSFVVSSSFSKNAQRSPHREGLLLGGFHNTSTPFHQRCWVWATMLANSLNPISRDLGTLWLKDAKYAITEHRESGMGVLAKSVTCFPCFFKSFNGPFGSCFGIIFVGVRCKVVKH